jgi:hypothetical protein
LKLLKKLKYLNPFYWYRRYKFIKTKNRIFKELLKNDFNLVSYDIRPSPGFDSSSVTFIMDYWNINPDKDKVKNYLRHLNIIDRKKKIKNLVT